MKAMVLKKTTNLADNRSPLELSDMPVPEPHDQEILVKVSVCGVCHTELDEIEGRTPPPKLPVIPGHQIIGQVEKMGPRAGRFRTGDRVGIAWIHASCGACRFCRTGQENLCECFKGTGRDADGGYAEYTTVHESYAYRIPERYSDAEAAPLLCAGAVGYRSLRLTNVKNGENIGLFGFGASGHLVLKMAKHLFARSKIYVFSRTEQERQFAEELGAVWAGDTEEQPPEKLQAVIDTTPAWKPVLHAFRNLEKGGRLVFNAIRKEDHDKDALLGIDYTRDLWMEKEIKSVANVTRKDIEDFFLLASRVSLRPEIQEYGLAEANTALIELRDRKIRGAKVLRIA